MFVAVGIRKVVQQYLPCPLDNMIQARTQILKLCTEHERYSYDLVLCADQEMQRIEADDDDRIARVVCEAISTVRKPHYGMCRALSPHSNRVAI